ncbi:hypothetical protein WAX74_13500 [Psychrobacillus sp. FJAT-51614]|uniref:Uncharacterized protein n=1 Tax=Psychrobacillus mangrovi TaxID=3117745 RepID=A0ABU8F6Q0_9BACI
MIKTLKGKVVAGTVAVTLFAGAGVAFGASDAGTNLQNWYNAKFTKDKIEVSGTAVVYSGAKLFGLGLENIKHKGEVAGQIKQTREQATSNTTSNINSKSVEHIKSINDQKTEILKNIGTQFDELYTDATSLMNKAGEESSKTLIKDLEKYSGNQGSTAIVTVESDLTGIKNTAVSNLQTAITNAKTDLEAKLKTEKDLTISEIKTMVDNKIIEIRNEIVKSRNDMISAQQKLINAKATEIETAAMGEMDALVSGILNK